MKSAMRPSTVHFAIACVICFLACPCSASDSDAGGDQAKVDRQTLDDGVYPVMSDDPRFEALAEKVGTIALRVLEVNEESATVSTIRIIKQPLVRFDESIRFRFKLEKDECTQVEFKNTKALKAFSKEFAPTRLAVVVGNQVVTHHKLRSAIESERIKITCCTEGGGDHLRKHLVPIAYSSEDTFSVEAN